MENTVKIAPELVITFHTLCGLLYQYSNLSESE